MPFEIPEEYSTVVCPTESDDMFVWDLLYTYTDMPSRFIPFASHIEDITDPDNVTALADLETFYDTVSAKILELIDEAALSGDTLDVGSLVNYTYYPVPYDAHSTPTSLEIIAGRKVGAGEIEYSISAGTITVSSKVASDLLDDLKADANGAGLTRLDLIDHKIIGPDEAYIVIDPVTSDLGYLDDAGVIQPLATGGGGGMTNPMTTLGDVIYGGASGTPTRLAGNINPYPMVLVSEGDSVDAAAPVWQELTEDMIPNLTAYVDVTNNQDVGGIKQFTQGIRTNLQYAVGIRPYGSGAGETGEVRFWDLDETQYIALKAPDGISSNVTLTLPDNDGTSGQVLVTDGSGVLSWSTPGSGLAPVAASYITAVAESSLSNEFALGSLATGLLKNTTTTGIPTIAVAGTDYSAPGHVHAGTDITSGTVAAARLGSGTPSASTVLRGDSTWVSYPGFGRTTATYTTASIASTAVETGTIVMAKSVDIISIQTSVAARVRLYATAALRTTDLARPVTVDPPAGSGLIAEIMTSGAVTFPMSPHASGSNLDGTPATDLYIAVQNLDSSSAAVAVTFTYLPKEA